RLTRETDALEFGAEFYPRDVVGPIQAVREIEHAREHAGPHHWRREARALLVGPADHLDGCLGLVVEIVEGTDHLEACEHAVDAVKAAAGRLRVEMAAGEDGRQLGVPSR